MSNIRTGLTAATAATGIAGVITAGIGRSRASTMDEAVSQCIDAVNLLRISHLNARMSGAASTAQLDNAQSIISACGEWERVNIAPIGNRATGAMIASGVGAGTGVAGTIVSAQAGLDADRNRTANILAGTAGGAQLVATVFNATQIGAIRRASEVSDACEDAINATNRGAAIAGSVHPGLAR